MSRKIINLPLTNDIVENLNAGDAVFLNGLIYVARDAAHQRLIDTIIKGDSLPIKINNSTIFYMGPTPTPKNEVIGSAGPTTSYRMDKYTPKLLDLGLKGMIGKGNRDTSVINSIIKNKAIYFTVTGGTGALVQSHIVNNRLIAYDDLGPEAILEIEVKDFPAIVTIDSKGNNLFNSEYKKFKDRD